MAPRHENSRPGIYRIRHIASGKTYIGQAVNVRIRMWHHRRALEHGLHDNGYLQAAWNKYGAEAFEFSVVLYCREPLLTENEQAALEGIPKELRYNIGDVVTSPNLGRQFSPEHCRRISEAKKGEKRTPEQKARYSEVFTGRKFKKTDAMRQRDIKVGISLRRPLLVVYPSGVQESFSWSGEAAEAIGVSRQCILQAASKGHKTRGGARVYRTNKDGSIKEPSKKSKTKEI